MSGELKKKICHLYHLSRTEITTDPKLQREATDFGIIGIEQVKTKKLMNAR